MKKINLLFAFFAFVFVSSQTVSGLVVSKNDHQAIPFAKIGILNSNFGTQANEKGEFKLKLDDISKDKELIVQVAGYETFRSSVGNFVKSNSHNISLIEKISNIQELVLTPKNYKYKNLGVKTKTKSVMYIPNMEKGDDVVRETAVKFNSSKRLKLEKININFARFDSTIPIKVRYTIYDEKDGKPNHLILDKDILATIDKDKLVDSTFSVDVSQDKIWLQGKFFVGIQFLGQSDQRVALSAALLSTGFNRSYYEEWEKTGFAAPAINIDIKVQK